jgi:hypothetical protein
MEAFVGKRVNGIVAEPNISSRILDHSDASLEIKRPVSRHFYTETTVRPALQSVLVAVFLAAARVAVAGPFEDGQAAYQRHDYAMALQVWLSFPVVHRDGSFFENEIVVAQGH